MKQSAFSLGAAVRACHQCLAAPPARHWILADRVTVDRATPGQQVLVRLGGVPATDSRGRLAHVRGIYFDVSVELGVAGATNDAVPAYQLRTLLRQIFLRDVTGWEYASALDARTLIDDQFFRFGEVFQFTALQTGIQALSGGLPTVTADEGLAQDVGAGSYDRSCQVYWPFQYPGRNPLRGLIPLPILQRVSNNALTFRLGTTSDLGATGVTVDGYKTVCLDGTTRDGLDVWLDVVYLDHPVDDAPWQIDEYTLADLSGTLLHPERKTEYAHMRYWPEDAAGQAGQDLAFDHDGITIQVAGFVEMGGLSTQDAITRGMLEWQEDRMGAISRLNAANLLYSNSSNGPLGYLSLLPYRDRARCASGPVSYQYSTRGATATFERYVQRTVAAKSGERSDVIDRVLRCGPCSCITVGANGMPDPANKDAYEPALVISRR